MGRPALGDALRRPGVRPLARAAHAALVAAEIAAERAIDRLARPAPAPRAPALDRLTLVVTTHERPRTLRRMLRSVRRLYPGVRVLVVDDSREPHPPAGAQLLAQPPNSGLSAGRRAALAATATEYVAMLDDDFVFTRRTDLPRVLALLDAHPEIDIVGGRVVDLPLYTSVDYASAAPFAGAAPPLHAAGTRIGGLPVYAKVPNFFVGRTERLRLVDWDPELRLAEHHDFFSRASGVLTSVYDERFACLHARTPFDARYMRDRMDVGPSIAALRRRWPGA